MSEDSSTARQKPKLPLIYVLLMATIAIVGLSHVQSSMKLDRVESELQRLEFLTTPLESAGLSKALTENLTAQGHRRVIDLVDAGESVFQNLTAADENKLKRFFSQHGLRN